MWWSFIFCVFSFMFIAFSCRNKKKCVRAVENDGIWFDNGFEKTKKRTG